LIRNDEKIRLKIFLWSDKVEQVSRPVVREISILENEGACFINEKKILEQDIKIPIPTASDGVLRNFAPSVGFRSSVEPMLQGYGVFTENKKRRKDAYQHDFVYSRCAALDACWYVDSDFLEQ
jgi:hypothetical protein